MAINIKKTAVSIAMMGLVLAPPFAHAQRQTLKEIVQKAVLANPEVLQRWHTYQAADKERDVAWGGYLPKVDLVAGVGREHRSDPTLKADFTRQSNTLTLTQMLYDGFATRNEVKRLDHARRVRLFELFDSSENVALEAARAYLDVLRYRKLVGLAEENYVRHRAVLEQIQKKVKAGVGRKVDLEQASGRMALAEANLLTETSNLHDVSARFQRLVGEMPAKEMEAPGSFGRDIPATAADLLLQAQTRHPAVQAAIENVRASEMGREVVKAGYQPRVDLRLRQERGSDLNGYTGTTDNRTAEVVLSWNLFNGLSDRARARQYADQILVSRDVRDKTCRDIRQTAAIAYNDARKLTEQIGYLDQHQLSIEKARDAYRKQFDIGQRTLLDLLDTENELFQARRAYTNAEYDLVIAQVRTHAGVGRLLGFLELSRVDDNPLPDIASWSAGGEAPEQCPPEAPEVYTADKAALDERAAEMIRDSIAATAAAQTARVHVARVTAPAAAPAAAAASGPEREIEAAVSAWAAAWSERKLQPYLDWYADNFVAANGLSRLAWAGKRRWALENAGEIQVEVKQLKVGAKDADHGAAIFVQHYRSANHRDTVRKTLVWQRIDGRWRIVREVAAPVDE